MSEATPGPRRSNYAAMPVAYAAIGASIAPDLMRFPPADSTPYEETLRLGSGNDRFLAAVNLLMTWGAQRIAGVEVSDIDPGEASDYPGVHFTQSDTPELGAAREELFTPEGEAYLQAGTTASFAVKGKESRRILVVTTVNETNRLGFAWGDRDEVAGFGEQLLTVEIREDGTVWAVARGFAFQPSSGLAVSLRQRAHVKDAIAQAQDFLQALAPGAAIRTGYVKPKEGDATAADEDSSPKTDTQPGA